LSFLLATPFAICCLAFGPLSIVKFA